MKKFDLLLLHRRSLIPHPRLGVASLSELVAAMAGEGFGIEGRWC
jgi:hypothetical protein